MSAQPDSLDYLTHPRDRVLFTHTPMLMMPRCGRLPPLAVGHKRYIAAADGIYLQARHRALNLTLKLTNADLPYGSLAEDVDVSGGLIPRALFDEIVEHALSAAPNEWAGLIHWRENEQRYALTIPQTVVSSASIIEYRTDGIDPHCLVLDIHTHGHGEAFFSRSHDDLSDQCGIYFASVLGHCYSRHRLTAVTRLVVYGQFFTLSWHPWEDE